MVEKTLTERKAAYAVHETEKGGHATEIASELTSDGADIIVLGGDGTFNEVLNGIKNFEGTTVGFVPCGTGNDYVKATKIPTDPEKAMKLITGGKTGYTDFIDMGDRRCLNVAGGGMDADVLVRYSTMKAFRGKIKYYASLIDVLCHLKFHKVRVTVDDEPPTEKSVFLISIANGIYIGGGMPISPDSVVDDGILNLVIVNEIKPSKVFGLLLKFLHGKHIQEPCTEVYRCERVKLEILDDSKTQADGEVMDKKILDCRLVHNKLKTYVE
jgi:YegS/Rv2252/BmrU family lipid kinase